MIVEKILYEVDKELNSGRLGCGLKIVRQALLENPENMVLLQLEAKILHLENIAIQFARPNTISFKKFKQYLRSASYLQKSKSMICFHGLNERFQCTHDLELFCMQDAFLTRIYGVHDEEGLPYWGTVLTRGDPSDGLTYPRGYPVKIQKPRHAEITLDMGFYVNYVQMRNFGHLLTETSSAIYPLLDFGSKNSLASLTILINEKYSSQNFQVDALVKLLGVARDQIIVIGQDVKSAQVKNLFMSKPSHINRSFVSNYHALIVRNVIRKKLRRSERSLRTEIDSALPIEKLYISRSKLNLNFRQFIQEKELENRLQELGWRIFHPQCHDLLSQIIAYESSSFICAPEGSAIHLLYGTNHLNLKKVILLCRNIENNFIKQLLSQDISHEPIACLEKVEAVREDGQPAPNYDVRLKDGLSVSDIVENINNLCQF